MNQRSILGVSISYDILAMLLILTLFVGSGYGLILQVEKDSDEALLSTIKTIESNINLYVDTQFREFEALVEHLPNIAPANHHLETFQDVYILDPTFKISKIDKQAPQSRIFKGYSFAKSALAPYLDQVKANEVLITPITRSTENDSSSIYYIAHLGDNRFVARVDVTSIQTVLTEIGSVFDRVILIASDKGDVLASSVDNLPFKVIPDDISIRTALGKPYVMTQHRSLMIDNDIITLTPSVAVNQSRMMLQSAIVVIALVISVLFIFKSFFIHRMVVVPFKNLVDQIDSFNPAGQGETLQRMMMDTREASMLYDAFLRKSREVEVEYRRLNTERLKALESLVEAEKFNALGSLVAGVAHEVNTPIGNCITSISYMKQEHHLVLKQLQEGNLSKLALNQYLDESRDFLEIVASNLNRASTLISNFKLLAVEQSADELMSFNLKLQIESVATVLKHELKQGQHQLEIQCPDDINLFSRPTYIHQLFTNLIMNAIVHGFVGMEAGKIRIIVKRNDQWICVDFMDNGQGIPEALHRRIFEPFFTTRRGSGGSGLGLNIVNNIVTKGLGGTIELEKTTSSAGVHFKIRFPIHSATG